MTQTHLIDSMESLVTSLGAKNNAVRYSNKRISDRELFNMYDNSWLTGKYINKTAEDMLKLPRTFSGDYNENLLKLVIEKENRLNINDIRENFLIFSSLYGDALIVAITDAGDLSQPYSDTEDIQRFIVLTKGEFTPNEKIDDDLKSANFGKPIYYTISNNNKVHHSRCHRLKLGKSKLTDKKTYGTSDLQNKYNSIRLFDTVMTCIGDIVQDSNVDVLFVPDLIAKIAAGKEDEIKKFVHLINQTKSSVNAIVLDAGNSEAQGRWEQKTATYSGLSEILTKLITVTSGALDRPITVLFGLSASGFSTGEDDLESYHGTINGLQESRLRPAQEFIDKFVLDKMMPNHGLTFEYPTIKVTNEDKEATRFNQFASAYSGLVTAGIIPDKVAQTELIARGLLINTTEDDFRDGDLFPSTEFPTGS
ncbi:DUF1073 domain-containing protein [Gilliamella apicola]|uniref:Anti-CBASS protein Acb1-like N-terminal domain-containing protein n=1 Tax=Gilliamella apicola TaxID=1196095 RepID=A0A242NLK2_9GAMM|nr:DUF1073 domain-containing protein [Gilliamella apicola]OTP81694.1 hypothetical protein B5S40_10165 [Gilliamella apicola]OTP85235.1 hypothetical protein B5S44_06180 [Gilliamella apicola]OTQ01624.1 hypothetical protein B6D08_00025 [Gilliamella apicola]OTQ11300.1 hypothetical protein B6C91_02910 [Gilliamella apicola]OTQ16408.1 hypothetical protein B6D11_03775 [Gilliamella apicola]